MHRELLLLLLLLLLGVTWSTADPGSRWAAQQHLSAAGLCRYAHCQQGCKHGVCVGPDRCRCHPGYTGKTCNQDLNECGLKPRPCKHRCMNTAGSYKCYCQDGYTLHHDGGCRDTRSCFHANCQYGCEVLKGDVRCTCPSPGLRLGPDARTCVDIDECVQRKGVCPRDRKCVNTFGSFLCNCHQGFKLVYINGRYTCTDKDTRPFCSLNPFSPKCRCRGRRCADSLAAPRRAQDDKTSPSENYITHDHAPDQEAEPSDDYSSYCHHPHGLHDNYHGNRFPRHHTQVWEFDVELGNTADEMRDEPVGEVLHCSMDQGVCDWLSDRDGDLDWTTVQSTAGGYYLSVPELKVGQRSVRGARLAVALAPPWNQDEMCFSFSHWLTGQHVGGLQLFISKTGHRYSPALWSRTEGPGWKNTRVTLERETERVLLRAERRRGQRGEIAVDDITLKRGPCR
ncbi:hypothetical protein CRUP_029432 [Coryphaenoides rupestris]|nr:hypothetical protein CRUP_029432 [Coryphaenoides rupestris]